MHKYLQREEHILAGSKLYSSLPNQAILSTHRFQACRNATHRPHQHPTSRPQVRTRFHSLTATPEDFPNCSKSPLRTCTTENSTTTTTTTTSHAALTTRPTTSRSYVRTHAKYAEGRNTHTHTYKMSHESVWFSRPRNYGKGSRAW